MTKRYIQKNGYDGLTLDTVTLIEHFCQAYFFNFQSNQDSFFAKDIKFVKNVKSY